MVDLRKSTGCGAIHLWLDSRSELTCGDIEFYSLGSDPLETGRDHTHINMKMRALKNRANVLQNYMHSPQRRPNRCSIVFREERPTLSEWVARRHGGSGLLFHTGKSPEVHRLRLEPFFSSALQQS